MTPHVEARDLNPVCAEDIMGHYRSAFTSRLVGSALFALGLAATAATAQAQTDRGSPPTSPPAVSGPANVNTNPVEGVTVTPAQRPALADIPKDKLAEYDAQVARDDAFRKYRDSTPRISADPNDQSKDFPGLQAYVPPK